MQKQCEECGTRFEPKRRTGRFCQPACRVRATRRRKTAGEPPRAGQADRSPIVVDDEPEVNGLLERIRTELAGAGRLDTVLGQQALVLASRLKEVSPDTASGLAAVSKELRSVMAEVMDGVVVESDPLDELTRRRASKLAG